MITISYSGEIGSKGANRRVFEKKLKDNIRSILGSRNYEKISIQNSKIIIESNAEKELLMAKLKKIPGISWIQIENEKIKGIGGLPVGTGGKLVSMLSGGIDSPVAAYMMMKRGCSISFVHFFNPTQNKAGVESKIIDIVKVLSRYQFKTKLYIIPFDEMQKEIIMKVPSKFRMIVYRRYMFKIGQKITENAKGFVTGDSLAQVASQTIDNMSAILEASDLPVLQPLIGMDKDSIISIAKEISTFRISTQPYNDCCSFFIAKHPETRADIKMIKQFEKNISVKYAKPIVKTFLNI